MSKGKFAKKGRNILGDDSHRPTNLADLMSDGKPETRKPVQLETREDVPQSVRHEFRLPYELAEKLRLYAFQNRTTKTQVVIDALEGFLGKQDKGKSC